MDPFQTGVGHQKTNDGEDWFDLRCGTTEHLHGIHFTDLNKQYNFSGETLSIGLVIYYPRRHQNSRFGGVR